MTVEFPPAGHRSLAADVEGGERIHLPGIRNTDDHSELLLHGWIGRCRLHSSEFQRRSAVLVKIGQDRGGLNGIARETQRRASAGCAGAFQSRRSILRDKRARNAVEGTYARQVVANDRQAARLPCADGLVQLVNRCFFQSERSGLCYSIMCRLLDYFHRPS